MKRSLYMRLNSINNARNIAVFLLIGILLITQDKAYAVIATLLFIAAFFWFLAVEKRLRAEIHEPVIADGFVFEQKTEPSKLTEEEARRMYEWLISNADLPLDAH